jgi:signal peptidase I
MKKIIKEILPYALIIIVVVFIRSYLVTPVTVDGPSMQKTLYTNDVMLLYKINKENVKRYDIIVLQKGNDRLIKRLIALPNETIQCKNGKIYINGKEESNEYGYGTNFDFDEVKLGSDEYFVMGDNRDDSLDSRYFGPIKKNQILGNTNFIIFPFNHFGNVK